MPLNMFVYPVVAGAKVPADFTAYGPAAQHPETMRPTRSPPTVISGSRRGRRSY